MGWKFACSGFSSQSVCFSSVRWNPSVLLLPSSSSVPGWFCWVVLLLLEPYECSMPQPRSYHNLASVHRPGPSTPNFLYHLVPSLEGQTLNLPFALCAACQPSWTLLLWWLICFFVSSFARLQVTVIVMMMIMRASLWIARHITYIIWFHLHNTVLWARLCLHHLTDEKIDALRIKWLVWGYLAKWQCWESFQFYLTLEPFLPRLWLPHLIVQPCFDQSPDSCLPFISSRFLCTTCSHGISSLRI